MATIRRTKAGTYEAQVRKKGHPPKTKTFRLKRDATEWAIRAEDAISRGLHFNRSVGERMTISEALDRYLGRCCMNPA